MTGLRRSEERCQLATAKHLPMCAEGMVAFNYVVLHHLLFCQVMGYTFSGYG